MRTALALARLALASGLKLAGRRAVVIGRSATVGRPAAHLLSTLDMTVTMAHTRTKGLAALCRERGVSEIVVGDSRDFAGEPNKITAHVKKFTKEIVDATGLPVHSEPEFWSSAQAERWQGKTEKLDASAAAIILQSFLDRNC